jgi:hypothetical protein
MGRCTQEDEMSHRSRFVAKTVGWGAAVALSLAALTPLDADAGSKKWKKHRRHHDRQVVVVHHHRPVVKPVVRRVVHVHNSCDVVRRPIVRYGDDRYYWNAAIGFYLDRGWVNVGIGNAPPRGSVYFDPHCDRSFDTLGGYRRHLERRHHPEVLEVRRVSYGRGDACGDDRDHGYREGYASRYDGDDDDDDSWSYED